MRARSLHPSLALVVILLACGGASTALAGAGASHPPMPTRAARATPTATVVPYHAPRLATGCTTPLVVMGGALHDCTGAVVVLRGASQPSALNNLNGWDRGQRPATDTPSPLNLATLQAMAAWHMNAVRVPISAYEYAAANGGSTYLGQLDTIVSNATGAGLYVILALFDDAADGSPYTGNLIHPEDVTFLTTLAAHYGGAPQVVYDLDNEPASASWSAWLTGCHTCSPVIEGEQDALTALRQAGAAQPVVLQDPSNLAPRCGNGLGFGLAGGFNGMPVADIPTDANVVYSLHVYGEVVAGNASAWTCAWGPLLGSHALDYGEWAALADPNYPSFCSKSGVTLTDQNADAITNTFLSWMATGAGGGGAINWTLWDFEPTPAVHAIADYATFTPSSFTDHAPWTCMDGANSAKEGMGSDVQAWLLANV